MQYKKYIKSVQLTIFYIFHAFLLEWPDHYEIASDAPVLLLATMEHIKTIY